MTGLLLIFIVRFWGLIPCKCGGEKAVDASGVRESFNGKGIDKK
jgi:hypothetical protein